jgi:hypothetical protein
VLISAKSRPESKYAKARWISVAIDSLALQGRLAGEEQVGARKRSQQIIQ